MRPAVIWRITLTLAAIVTVETIVCGVAAAPVVWLWRLAIVPWTEGMRPPGRTVLIATALAPSYVLFALILMPASACATWLTRARTPANAEMRIVEYGWPMLRWVRYAAAIHVVRVVAGTLFRGSPVWSAYLRLNGAHIGRRVYVNTTFIGDHNLLAFADDVVIGAEVHISGHTVEHGIVKTGRVRIGTGAMIGLGSLIDIDTDVGDRCQVGALSVVPKHTRLAADATYAGAPVARIK